MPGYSPHEAVGNYIAPLQRAVSCLAIGAKVLWSGKVKQVGDEGSWLLNGDEGLLLTNGWRFFAEQRFRVVDMDPERYDMTQGKFRVSTTMYAYKMVIDKQDQWRLHWHPKGEGRDPRPHMHIAPNLDGHAPTGRITLEDAVEVCIVQGAPPACADWKVRLMESGGIHKLYRTWTDQPPEQSAPHDQV